MKEPTTGSGLADTIESWGDRTEVDDHVFEGARIDASSSIARRDGDLTSSNLAAVMGDVLAVAGQAVVASIKDLGSKRVRGAGAPVPVWLVASVTTLITEGLFEEPSVVAVPGEEVGGTMDGQRLLDVDGNKVVVAAAGTRNHIGVNLRGELHQAEDRINVGPPLVLGEARPAECEKDFLRLTDSKLYQSRLTATLRSVQVCERLLVPLELSKSWRA